MKNSNGSEINSDLVDEKLDECFALAKNLEDNRVLGEDLTNRLSGVLSENTHKSLARETIEYKLNLISIFGKYFDKIPKDKIKIKNPKTTKSNINLEKPKNTFDSLFAKANPEVQWPTKEELEKDQSKPEWWINFLIKIFDKEKVKSAFEKWIISISDDGWLIFGDRKIGPNDIHIIENQKGLCDPEKMIKFFKDFAEHFSLKFHEPKYTTNNTNKSKLEFTKDNYDFCNNNNIYKYNNPNSSLFKMIWKLINRKHTWIPVFACSDWVIGCSLSNYDSCEVLGFYDFTKVDSPVFLV